MANINNATVKVEGIDPTANAINSRIVADIFGGGQEAINGYANGLGNALLTYDRDTSDGVNNGFSNVQNQLNTIIAELNIFQTYNQRGTYFLGYQTTGANPAACLSSLMTYLNASNPDAKLHSYQITPANAAYTNFYITAVLIL
jgi:hypothetical protein